MLCASHKGHDTRVLQAYLGHRDIQHTVRYTEFTRADQGFSARMTQPIALNGWEGRVSITQVAQIDQHSLQPDHDRRCLWKSTVQHA